jgi:hypothetical protein
VWVKRLKIIQLLRAFTTVFTFFHEGGRVKRKVSSEYHQKEEETKKKTVKK